MRAVLLMVLAGCGPSALAPGSVSPVELSAEVDAAKVASGQPVVLRVRAATSDGWTLQVGPPAADGLQVSLSEQTGPVRVGEQDVNTWVWNLSGPDGSYVVVPAAARASGPAGESEDPNPPSIFVDIGVPGPSAGALADFAEVPPVEPTPWGLYAALAGGALLAAGGLAGWAWRRSHRPVPPPLPDPPHLVALRAWEQARLEITDDHALALALSMVLREYLEAILGWPATARTTREILAHLERETRLGVTDRLRAQRVLDATDRLKFAREGGGGAFFDALEADFRAVVDATRPVIDPVATAGGGS